MTDASAVPANITGIFVSIADKVLHYLLDRLRLQRILFELNLPLRLNLDTPRINHAKVLEEDGSGDGEGRVLLLPLSNRNHHNNQRLKYIS